MAYIFFNELGSEPLSYVAESSMVYEAVVFNAIHKTISDEVSVPLDGAVESAIHRTVSTLIMTGLYSYPSCGRMLETKSAVRILYTNCD